MDRYRIWLDAGTALRTRRCREPSRLPVDRITWQPTVECVEGRYMLALNRTREWLIRNFAGSLLAGWLVIAAVGLILIRG